MDKRNTPGEARTLGMPGAEGRGAVRHSLQVFGREQAVVEGVVAVESFDDEVIIMETDMGVLTLKGEDLNIKQLDLTSGRFSVEGFINSCVYTTPRNRGIRQGKTRGFLERLLK